MELRALVTEPFLAGAKGAEVLGRFRSDVIVEEEIDSAFLFCSWKLANKLLTGEIFFSFFVLAGREKELWLRGLIRLVSAKKGLVQDDDTAGYGKTTTHVWSRAKVSPRQGLPKRHRSRSWWPWLRVMCGSFWWVMVWMERIAGEKVLMRGTWRKWSRWGALGTDHVLSSGASFSLPFSAKFSNEINEIWYVLVCVNKFHAARRSRPLARLGITAVVDL